MRAQAGCPLPPIPGYGSSGRCRPSRCPRGGGGRLHRLWYGQRDGAWLRHLQLRPGQPADERHGGWVTTTYAYDGDGKRISSTVGGTTTRYVYDVGGGLPVLLDDGARKYVWGQELAYTTNEAGTLQGVYHTDGLGSVRAITDSTGSVVQTYQTDEFGIPTQAQGASPQPFGYTGEQVDATGLVYLRARMYDPSSGRFLQRDPLAGHVRIPFSLNRFTYAVNSSLNRTDPSGHDPLNRVTHDQGCSQPLQRLFNPLCNPVPLSGREFTIRPQPIGSEAGAFGPGLVLSAPEPDPKSQGDVTATIVEYDAEGAFDAIVRTSTGRLIKVLASVIREQGGRILWKE